VTGRRAGFITRTASYYRTVWRTLIEAGLATLWLAEHDDRPVAGSMTWHCGDRELYMYGATNEAGRKVYAAYGLLWRAITEASERGAAVGFRFGQRNHVWNTFTAHRMPHWATLEGGGVELERALLRAYHGEGRNPGATDVLVELAGAVGLDAARAKSIAEGNEYARDVREREQHWLQCGVSGVPYVVVNGKYAIEGAQPPEYFEQALRQTALPR